MNRASRILFALLILCSARPAPAQPASSGTVIHEAALLPLAPDCRAMVGRAATIALSDTPEADGARTLAVHDLLVRTVRLCPSPSLAPYWTKVSQAASALGSKGEGDHSGARLPEQDLAAARHIVASLNLRPDCQAALEEGTGDYLAQAAGAGGMHPAVLLASYAVLGCPEAAFDKLWPSVELAYVRIQAGRPQR